MEGFLARLCVIIFAIILGFPRSSAEAKVTFSAYEGLWHIFCDDTPLTCAATVRSPGDNTDYATITLFPTSDHSVKIKFTAKPSWNAGPFTIAFGNESPIAMNCASVEPMACTLSQSDSDFLLPKLASSNVIILHVNHNYTILHDSFGPMTNTLSTAVRKFVSANFQMNWPVSHAPATSPVNPGAWCQTPVGGCDAVGAPGDDCHCPTPAGYIRGWIKKQ